MQQLSVAGVRVLSVIKQLVTAASFVKDRQTVRLTPVAVHEASLMKGRAFGEERAFAGNEVMGRRRLISCLSEGNGSRMACLRRAESKLRGRPLFMLGYRWRI